ncbi:MAG: alkaline phosphatase family protein [Planctomycetota bacterium]|nr:alkaline phosphatase family protein [Planctomycetota bacterium]
MTPLLVLNVVGLTRALLAKFPGRARSIEGLAKDGASATLGTVLPAVTTSAQATFLTGLMPRDHGVVANGWYFRELAEVHFWKQSNYLVGGEKVWDAGHKRDPKFTSAQICWWYNMYSANDVAVTMRPYEGGPGVVSLLYTKPPELALQLDEELGRFPLFDFWGPRAGIVSSEWIERCARSVRRRFNPTLTLVYLPHLDYNLQRLGPDDPRIGDDLAAIDAVVGRLATEQRAQGGDVIVLSEYGLTRTSGAVDINRILRRNGYLAVQQQLEWELLDCGACRAFAASDHQVAHVYVKDPADRAPVKALLEKTPGIERVLDEGGKKEFGLDHARAGDLVAVSAPDRWFTYYYWEDPKKAPGWAHEVDIHSKPGYDPLELFMDPKAPLKIPRIFARLALRKLGFDVGAIMNFVPQDVALIKGSHGRLPDAPEEGPVFITSAKRLGLPDHVAATDVKALMLKAVFG